MADNHDNNNDRTVIAGSAASAAPPGGQEAANQQAPDNTLPIGTRLAEFELIGLVGAGGFGIVYLAEDHSLGRRVALKEYMPAALATRGSGIRVTLRSERNAETFEAGRRSFVNEARLLAQFDHPALVKVYRFWEDNGTAYMVMPYYEGVTLKRALQDMAAPPDETWLRRLLGPLLDALEVMHAAQVYHRDIAPDNIMLLAGGRPLLLDFGAARHVISDMTQALTVILKPGYAPVEQYAEMPELKQGAWTDIYALAAVVYLAIVGRTPPPAVGRLMNDTLKPLAEQAAGRYSDGFLRAIDHALAVRPNDRPQSIAEFRALLQLQPGAEHSLTAPHPAPGTGEQKRSAASPATSTATTGSVSSSRTKPLAIAGVIGLVVVAAIGYLLRGEAPTPTAEPASTPAPTETAPPPPAAAAAQDLPAAPVPTPAPPARTAAPPEAVAIARPPAAEPPVASPPAAPLAAPADDSGGRPAPAVSTPAQGAPAPSATEHPMPFSAITEIERIHRERDPARDVSVAVANPQVRIGVDRLSFRVRSNTAGYLYVLMVGTDNHFYKLFPNAVDKDNRMRADTWLELPRRGWLMTAGGPAGANHLVAIVSERPRDFASSGIVDVDPFAEFPLDLAAQIATLSPGGQSPFLGQPVCPQSTQPCPADYGAAAFTIVEIDAPRR
jgi:serine/threonine protein kinase